MSQVIDANRQDSTVAANVDYVLDEAWPKYPLDMDFEMGAGVTVDDQDIIYLFIREKDHWGGHPLSAGVKMGKMSAKTGKSCLAMFDRSGNYLGKWGPSDEPGFALTAHTVYFIDDHFWVVDRDGHTVIKYDKSGHKVLTLGTFGEWGSDERHFNGPTGVIVQPNGNIVVTDGYWNSRMIWFTPTGQYIKEIGGYGTGPGQFLMPHAVAQLPDGRLLVAEAPGGDLHDYCTVRGQIAEHRKVKPEGASGRIQIFDADGKFLEQWAGWSALSVVVYGDRVYVSQNMHDLVILDASTLEEIGRHEDLAIYIHQLAIDSRGDLYIATVYPENAGQPRGREGPSHRHWIKLDAAR